MFDYTRSFYNPREPRELPSQSAGIDVLTGARKAARDALVDSANQNDARERARTRRQTFADILTPISAGLNAIVSRGNDQPVQIGAEFADPIHPDNRNMLAMARGGEFDEEDVLIVGEEGPEVVIPRQGGGGTVIPNELLNSPEQYGLGQTEDERGRANVDLSGAPVTGPASGMPDNRGALDPMQKEYEELAKAQEVKPSPWKDFGYGLLQGLNNALNHRNAPIEGWSEKKARQRAEPIAARIALKERQAKINSDRAYRDLQMKNIEEDNSRLEQQRKDRLEVEKQKGADRAQADVFKSKTFDKNNVAHRARAERAGLDPEKMASWDFTNPVRAKVNGVEFERDRLTGEWNQSGLPESEKDKIISLDISVPGEVDENGKQKIRKFNVAQSQAASLSASLQAAGMQIEASAARQASTQEHETRKIQMQGQIRMLLEQYKAAAAAGKAAQAQQFLLQMQAVRQQARQEGLDR